MCMPFMYPVVVRGALLHCSIHWFDSLTYELCIYNVESQKRKEVSRKISLKKIYVNAQ